MAELDNQEVFLPEAVRRAAARSAELSAQVYGDQHTPETPPAPATPADSGTPVAPPAVEVRPEPPAAPPAAPSPPPTPQQPPGGSPDWEQRYRTLQGKYDTELPSLRAQVASLENLIRSMQTAPPVAPPAAPPVPAQGPITSRPTISQEDIDNYGPELIEAHQRWTGAYVQPQLDDLSRQLNEIKGGQQRITVSAMHERVHAGLDADPELAGVWRQLNPDPQFFAWLQQPDEFSGQVRYTLLQEAYNGGDAMRAGRFFKRYIAEHTGGSTYTPPPPPQTAPAQPAPYQNGNGHAPAPAGGPRLDDFVAPGRPSGSTNNGNGAPEKKIWTTQEISKFFDDRRRGRWAGREAESLAIEADIFAAANEERVRR